MFPDDRKVVVWESEDQDGDGWGIIGQLLDADDLPVGTEFQLNQYTSGNQNRPELDMNSTGNFAVVWQSEGQDGFGNGIIASRYDSTGNRMGLLPW